MLDKIMELAITNNQCYVLIVCRSRIASSSVCLELPIYHYYLVGV